MIAEAAPGDRELAFERAGRQRKSPTAFRTISEVADDLHVPQHVLRFWETRFLQVKPLKRGGGRRYYRPDDVELLRRIADLLYVQGYTIKGVQRLLIEGDGTLEGELPPPSDADRDEPSTHAPQPHAPQPYAPQPYAPQPYAPEPYAFEQKASGPSPESSPGQPLHHDREPADEVAALRQLLADILVELEAMRRQLAA